MLPFSIGCHVCNVLRVRRRPKSSPNYLSNKYHGKLGQAQYTYNTEVLLCVITYHFAIFKNNITIACCDVLTLPGNRTKCINKSYICHFGMALTELVHRMLRWIGYHD